MDNKKIKIAIIDDGVNEKICYGLTGKLIKQFYIDDNGKVKPVIAHKLSMPITHGTICSLVLLETCPNIKQLTSIKILDDDKMQMELSKFYAALKWCIKQNINIVSCSVGTTFLPDPSYMNKLLSKAKARNIVIVGANGNENIISYPASLPQVIGVRYDWQGVIWGGQYVYNTKPTDGIEITTSLPKFELLHKIDRSIAMSNSFSAPYIAAKIYCEITAKKKATKIRTYLKNKALKFRYSVKPITETKINIPIAAIPTFNKNDKLLTLFSKLLTYHFRRHGYQTVIIGAQLKNDLKNLSFKCNADKHKTIDYFDTLSTIANPDIIIFIGNNNLIKQLDMDNLLDIVITAEKKQSNYKATVINISDVYCPKDNSEIKNYVSDIYQRVINSLT